MKKSFLFATMLLSMATFAQQRTFVKSVGANYATGQVTFNISWAAGSRGVAGANTYNSRVWVLIDYREIQNGVAVGNWQRADVLLSSLPAGCTADGTNTKGFWYQGQETAAQHANITVTLSDVPVQFQWCAIAVDCPPSVTGTASFAFKGTPPFTVQYADGSTCSVSTENHVPPAGKTFAALVSDYTGQPGCIAVGGLSTFQHFTPCKVAPGISSTWTLVDTRDNKPYSIKYTPDHRYWMVQDLMYGGVPDKCAGKTTFRGATSPATAATNQFGTGTYGNCRNNPYEGGYYYDWAAAMQHPNAYKGAADATVTSTGSVTGSSWWQGLCPENWHVPTADECRHAKDVNGTDLYTYWFNANGFNWSRAYYICNTDYVFQFTYGSTDSWLWTATRAGDNMHSLEFGWIRGTSLFAGFDGDGVGPRDGGKMLRCVKNY